ncbi:MAG: MerC domain-containing protein [Verrucomicrobiales bacterium]
MAVLGEPVDGLLRRQRRTRRGETGKGVVASVLCAIHCAVTPILLLFAPAFGELWAHPASHWIVALFVVPLAFVMLLRGFRVHGKRWILAAGLLGMVLVIAGAMIPYLPESNESAVVAASVGPTEALAEENCPHCAEDEMSGEETETAAEECVDSCCPSLATDEEGDTKLQIPAASIVTTLGGLALICTHLDNLCACRKCKGNEHCISQLC